MLEIESGNSRSHPLCFGIGYGPVVRQNEMVSNIKNLCSRRLDRYCQLSSILKFELATFKSLSNSVIRSDAAFNGDCIKIEGADNFVD